MVEKIRRRLPMPNISSEPKDVRQRVEALEVIMERLIDIPGTNRKVGLDVIMDFVPVVGPTVAAVIGSYLAWEARNLGMSKWAMTRMAKPLARRATSLPMLPRPTMPRVLPWTSAPNSRGQSPARVSRSARAT